MKTEKWRGKADATFAKAIDHIEYRDAVNRLQRAFITAHRETLAGLSWRMDYLGDGIHIEHRFYRGRASAPVEIARLWPNALWARAPDAFASRTVDYHWEALVDGVTLRIENTEKEDTRPQFTLGPIAL